MNFFKKYETTIYAVIIFVIIITVGIFLGINDAKKEQKSLSNYHKELKDNKEPNQPSRTKRENIESPNPKKQITKEDFEKIKNYILSENKDTTLTLTLSQKEITEINEIKKNLINFNKSVQSQSQSWIDEYQQECDNYNKQISELNPDQFYEIKKKSLTEQLQGTERLKENCIRGLHRRLEQNKQSALSELNSLYEITSSEG
ncbi:MAG: hypothetical protein AB3N34_02250 [Lettuce witches'-broom phytoplasma]